jgi:hypothetical protein
MKIQVNRRSRKGVAISQAVGGAFFSISPK